MGHTPATDILLNPPKLSFSFTFSIHFSVAVISRSPLIRTNCNYGFTDTVLYRITIHVCMRRDCVVFGLSHIRYGLRYRTTDNRTCPTVRGSVLLSFETRYTLSTDLHHAGPELQSHDQDAAEALVI